jgi:ketosteroid isomerase-like protein
MNLKIPTLLLALCLPLLANEQDKEALRNLRAVYERAIATKDLAALKPHLAADFTAVMITAEEVKGFDGILEYWKKVEQFIGEDGSYKVELEPDDTVFEGNLAIAKGRAKEQVLRRGKPIEFTTLWTAVARKEGDTWKLVRLHAGIDPVGNPIIGVLQGYRQWFIGLAALLVGLLAGRFLPRLKSRR